MWPRLFSSMLVMALGLGMVPSPGDAPLYPGAATAAMVADGGRASDGARIVRAELPVTGARTAATQSSATQSAPLALVVLTDAAGVHAAAGLLDAVASAGSSPAGLCLPLDALDGADAALEQEVAVRLRPALNLHGVPACLAIRPAGPETEAAGSESAGALRAALTRARAVLGTAHPIAEVRLDLSRLALSPMQAAAETASVGRVVHEVAPEARLSVVLGGFAGVAAGRPSGAAAYLAALDRWHAAQREALAGSGLGVVRVDLALEGVPPRVVALAQDWLRARGIAAGVELPGETGAVERLARPLLGAGGSVKTLAVRLSRPSAEATSELEVDALAPFLTSFADLRRVDPLPRLELRDAPVLTLPGLGRNDNDNGNDNASGDTAGEPHPTDSNSPLHWDGDTLYLFTSVGRPRRSQGSSLFDLGLARPVRIRGDDEDEQPRRWLEATYKARGGTLYGWYHEEPADVCPDATDRAGVVLTAPRIGAMVSEDEGRRWRDLGIILEAPPRVRRCDTANRFFAGGVGDFAVIPDRIGSHLYFVFSSFGPEPDQQGIGLARIGGRDLDAPVGAVWRWSDAGWTEPGLRGRGALLYPATSDWHRPGANAFWGPAVHWNTYLERYVLLLNRAGSADWSQAGAYVAFAETLAEPLAATIPRQFRERGDWYVQAIGTDAARRETDTLFGRTARYFEHGVSRHELVFHRPGE